jgi:hypothetical protein
LDIDFAANHVDEWDDDAQTGLYYHAVTTEALDGPLIPLRHNFDARNDNGNRDKHKNTQTQ